MSFTMKDNSSDPYIWMIEGADWRDVEQGGVENWVRAYVKVSIEGQGGIISNASDETIYRQWRSGWEFDQIVQRLEKWIADNKQMVHYPLYVPVMDNGRSNGHWQVYRKMYGKRGGAYCSVNGHPIRLPPMRWPTVSRHPRKAGHS